MWEAMSHNNSKTQKSAEVVAEGKENSRMDRRERRQ